MKILHELSWLWETLGIALVAAVVCMACAALIGKAAKKKLSKDVYKRQPLSHQIRRGRIAPSLSTSSVTGTYAFLYCVAICVFLTPVPLYRCMPVRMIFGSINACPFELLKRCNFFVYNYSCPLTG